MEDQQKYTSKLRGKHVLRSSLLEALPVLDFLPLSTYTSLIYLHKGVGYAVADAAFENGCKVTISSSNAGRVESATKALQSAYTSMKGQIQGCACDVSSRTSIESKICDLLNNTGEVDHLVYTAGDGIPPTPIGEATLEAIEHAMTVRYIAPVLLAKHAPKYLTKSFESSITLTTGIVTERPIPNWSVIGGGRLAVVGLGKNLALDLRPIRINVVALGAVDTNTWSHLPQEAKEQTFKALVTKSTTGRIADASDVAEAYLYCMKDRNVTGSVISTNGGALLV